ncbi:hypothetical protein CDD83_10746 [Cordyceps sp. RAO-2017]|nr:hypothetical protein CDD83_10746 [Cordyceps sp. RAO-2017]
MPRRLLPLPRPPRQPLRPLGAAATIRFHRRPDFDGREQRGSRSVSTVDFPSRPRFSVGLEAHCHGCDENDFGLY